MILLGLLNMSKFDLALVHGIMCWGLCTCLHLCCIKVIIIIINHLYKLTFLIASAL